MKAIFVGAVLLAALAHAEPSAQEVESTDILAVRLGLISGFIDFASIAIAPLRWRPLEFEAGLGAGPGSVSEGSQWSVYARAGYDLIHFDGRAQERRGFTLYLAPMAGLRYGNYAYVPHGSPNTFGINAVAAFDATYWFTRHFGLGLQLVSGVVYWIGPINGSHFDPDIRLTLGLSF